MTTLISAGRFRCDATCHNARKAVCSCICAGALHGRGPAGALAALAGVEVRLPPGVEAARVHLPAEIRPGGPMFDHYVTLTVRWNGPPDQVELVGGALVLAAGDVVGALMPANVQKIVDVRVAPWITIEEEDRLNIDRALRATGKDPATWWNARFLQLCAKSDAAHLEALRAAAPTHVDAWEAWRAAGYNDRGWEDELGRPLVVDGQEVDYTADVVAEERAQADDAAADALAERLEEGRP